MAPSNLTRGWVLFGIVNELRGEAHASLIPDRRYLTEKNQTALARFAERIGACGSNDVIYGGIDPEAVEARLHDHVILRWDPCHGDASATFL